MTLWKQRLAAAAFLAFLSLFAVGARADWNNNGINLPLGTIAVTSGDILVADGSNYVSRLMSGDCTMTSAGVITCTKTGGVSFGSLATLSAAPAGTLSGTTLNSSVVTSSLTSVGTLTGGATGAGFTINLSASTVSNNLPCANHPALTGDITTPAGSCATVLKNTGPGAGSFTAANITIDAQGRVTAAANGSAGGTVTTTGSPANGNLAKFSGTTSVTNTDLTGDVATAGGVSTTIQPNVVTNAKFRQGAALSVVGVTGTSTANEADIAGTTNQVLRVNGAGTALSFGAIDLSQAAAVTNTLPAGNGGTGVVSSTQYGVMIGNAGNALHATAQPTAGAVLMGNGAADPTFQVPTNIQSGFLNKFRNASMNHNQRGIAATTVTTAGAYTLDGWIVTPTGASVVVDVGTNPATLPMSVNALKVTGATSVTDLTIKQRIDANWVESFDGQSVTVQYKFQNNTGGSVTPTLTIKHAGATNDFTSPVTDVNAVSESACTNGSTCTESYTFLASTSSHLGIEATFDFGNNFSSGAKNILFMEPDIRVTANVATGAITPTGYVPVPEMRYGSIENTVNRSYFYAVGGTAGVIATCTATSTTAFGCNFISPAYSRGFTGITTSSLGNLELMSYAAADVAALSTLSFSKALGNEIFLTGTVASGLTSGTAYMLYVKTTTTPFLLFTGGEL